VVRQFVEHDDVLEAPLPFAKVDGRAVCGVLKLVAIKDAVILLLWRHDGSLVSTSILDVCK